MPNIILCTALNSTAQEGAHRPTMSMLNIMATCPSKSLLNFINVPVSTTTSGSVFRAPTTFCVKQKLVPHIIFKLCPSHLPFWEIILAFFPQIRYFLNTQNNANSGDWNTSNLHCSISCSTDLNFDTVMKQISRNRACFCGFTSDTAIAYVFHNTNWM